MNENVEYGKNRQLATPKSTRSVAFGINEDKINQ